jgi:hypothetical protein
MLTVLFYDPEHDTWEDQDAAERRCDAAKKYLGDNGQSGRDDAFTWGITVTYNATRSTAEARVPIATIEDYLRTEFLDVLDVRIYDAPSVELTNGVDPYSGKKHEAFIRL